jgi:hypothetical protein
VAVWLAMGSTTSSSNIGYDIGNLTGLYGVYLKENGGPRSYWFVRRLNKQTINIYMGYYEIGTGEDDAGTIYSEFGWLYIGNNFVVENLFWEQAYFYIYKIKD